MLKLTFPYMPNPHFDLFAQEIRKAEQALEKAGEIAATRLYRTEFNFERVRRHLREIARLAEQRCLWKAFTRYNSLTDADIRHGVSIARHRGVWKNKLKRSEVARANGRKGGLSRSEAKTAAAKENGKLGGRPLRTRSTDVRVAGRPDPIAAVPSAPVPAGPAKQVDLLSEV